MGLYAGDPYVAPIRDLTLVHASSSTVYALEFFAGWCGHCQQFAGIWKQVARQSCASAPRLIVGAIDCVADFLLCQELGVTSYPTIRVFGPGGIKKGTPLKQCHHGCRSPKDVIADILRVTSTLKVPSGFLPTSADAVIAATAQHECGRAPPPTASSGASSSRAGGSAPGGGHGASGGGGGGVGVAPPELLLKPMPLEDVTSAIIYGLQHELFASVTSDDRNNPRRKALDAWLGLLEAATPGGANREALGKVRQLAWRVTRAADWAKALRNLPSPLLPVGGSAGGIAWKACRGWSAESRGYPCGLWSLFHTLLAHAKDPAAALLAIEGYVEFFFGCNACATHFLSMARGANGEARSLRGAPDGIHGTAASDAAAASLWLWRAHNAVNARLNLTDAAVVLRLGLPKQQWPSRNECAQCRMPSGRWRESAVEALLARTYCHPQQSACYLAADGNGARAGGGSDGSDEQRRIAAAPDEAGGASTPPWMTAVASAAMLLLVCGSLFGWFGGTPKVSWARKRSAQRRMRAVNAAALGLAGAAGGGPNAYEGLPQREHNLSGEE